MLKRDWLFGTVVAVLGFAPMAVYASADCQASDAEALVAPPAIFSALASPTELNEIPYLSSRVQPASTTTMPFKFQLMSPVWNIDTRAWQMPPGRYWFSVEVIEAKLTQEGIGIPDENIESWLLAPADSLAVPF
jgi:hypothetical protein